MYTRQITNSIPFRLITRNHTAKEDILWNKRTYFFVSGPFMSFQNYTLRGK